MDELDTIEIEIEDEEAQKHFASQDEGPVDRDMHFEFKMSKSPKGQSAKVKREFFSISEEEEKAEETKQEVEVLSD